MTALRILDWLTKAPRKPAEPERGSMRNRTALILAILAVPAMAAPGDFGAVAGDAPFESEQTSRKMAAMPAMPFERPGMSFPGSAFFYLADPPSEALVALPTADPLDAGAEDGRELGALIDAGPAAKPFFSASGTSHLRARECLAQAIWYEAASESEAGQRAVAQVVLNRVSHPSWPGSVCGVVYQGSERSTGCQFSFTCDGSLARTAKGASWRKARDLASDALSGSVYAPIGHATHYHTLWVNPVWAGSLDHIGTIGAHRFYRNRGALGEKAAFTARYAGEGSSAPIRTSNADAAAPTPSAAPAPAISYEPVSSAIASGQSAPSAAPDAEVLPMPAKQEFGQAGQVKREYANAGRWKKRPPQEAADEAVPAPSGGQ